MTPEAKKMLNNSTTDQLVAVVDMLQKQHVALTAEDTMVKDSSAPSMTKDEVVRTYAKKQVELSKIFRGSPQGKQLTADIEALRKMM